MRLLSTIKSKLTAILAIVLALCFGFAAIACDKKESDYEYNIRIAKEKFGCERILWYHWGSFYSGLLSVYLYRTSGRLSSFPDESLFEQGKGGTYVLGVDKHGYEKFIAIPNQESTKQNSKQYSPRLIQWPFSYSFTEIANFAAEYGYEYADGVDGHELDEYKYKVFDVADTKDRILYRFENLFDDVDKKYDALDVKFVLLFSHMIDDSHCKDYFITQEGGKLMMYEYGYIDGEEKPSVNVIEYERDKQDAETPTV